ncbi:hypothetical protein VCV18_009891 [Metarhizium anisopliae]
MCTTHICLRQCVRCEGWCERDVMFHCKDVLKKAKDENKPPTHKGCPNWIKFNKKFECGGMVCKGCENKFPPGPTERNNAPDEEEGKEGEGEGEGEDCEQPKLFGFLEHYEAYLAAKAAEDKKN